jgi:para-nitrobenzyl esterase
MNDVASGPEPIAEIAAGRIGGARVDGVVRFLSVPYAAPPLGERRFLRPQPHAPWGGVRDALTPGPSAPQHTPEGGRLEGLDLAALIGEGAIPGDDFLAANIWTPDPAAVGLPVMVFIHGGAFLLGSKDAPVYDGAAFARSGVVLISINYRLGLEGFVHIPGGDSNLGLRDQIAALEWVRDNAAAFGGDGANVTVFGESAGAMTISDLVASPLAKGLFRRAIVQSGHGALVRPIPTALRLTRLLAKRLKVNADIDGFRSRSLEEGLAAVAWASDPKVRVDLRDGGKREPTLGLSKFLPVFGDEVLPEPPMDALKKGVGAEIDLLIGSNRDEMNLYFVPTGVRRKIGGLLARFMLSRVQPRAGAVLRDYGLGRKGVRAGDALTEAMTDLMFRWPARRFAEEHQGHTHVYEFGWRSDACGGQLGACHGLELPFVFDTLACATGPEGLCGSHPPADLARSMHRIWVDFARAGTLPWPEYRREDRQVYALESGVAAAEPIPPAAAHLP